jgi:hypothetical protein
MSSFTANQIRNTYVPFIQNVGERGLASFSATPGVPTFEIVKQYEEDTRKELIIGLQSSTIGAYYRVIRNTFNAPVTVKSDSTSTSNTATIDIFVEGYDLKTADFVGEDWNTFVEFPTSMEPGNFTYVVGTTTGAVQLYMPFIGFDVSSTVGAFGLIFIKITYFTESQKQYEQIGTIQSSL